MELDHLKEFFEEVKRMLELNHIDEPSTNEKYCIGCNVDISMKTISVSIDMTNELDKGLVSFKVLLVDSNDEKQQYVTIDSYNNDGDLKSTVTLLLDSIILLTVAYIWEDRKKEVNSFE